MRDDRYAVNLASLHAIGARDLAEAGGVVNAYAASLNALPRKTRTAPFTGSASVTVDRGRDGSASVTAERAGDGSTGGAA